MLADRASVSLWDALATSAGCPSPVGLHPDMPAAKQANSTSERRRAGDLTHPIPSGSTPIKAESSERSELFRIWILLLGRRGPIDHRLITSKLATRAVCANQTADIEAVSASDLYRCPEGR